MNIREYIKKNISSHPRIKLPMKLNLSYSFNHYKYGINCEDIILLLN